MKLHTKSLEEFFSTKRVAPESHNYKQRELQRNTTGKSTPWHLQEELFIIGMNGEFETKNFPDRKYFTRYIDYICSGVFFVKNNDVGKRLIEDWMFGAKDLDEDEMDIYEKAGTQLSKDQWAFNNGVLQRQVQRLNWKLNLIDQVQQRLAAPASSFKDFLDGSLTTTDDEDIQFVKIKVKGSFVDGSDMYVGLRSRGAAAESDDSRGMSRNPQGYFVYEAFNVDPSEVPGSKKPLRILITGPVEIEVVLRNGEDISSFPTNEPAINQWYSIDVDGMSKWTNSEPILVDMISNSKINEPLLNTPGAPLARNGNSIQLKNNHLAYAITWFGMCGITAFLIHGMSKGKTGFGAVGKGRKNADEHFARLKGWGLTFVRLLVTWEALEHSGPGIYDEQFIDYLICILKKADKYGIKCFIDPHQDTWSRFSGGSGAPGWTFEVAGMDITAFHAVGAAHVHNFNEDVKNPHMFWPTNYAKLACATMFTLFFAGHVLAPDLMYKGQNVGTFLQDKYIACYTHLARRLKDCKAVVGFEFMNEPHYGYIGLADINKFDSMVFFHFGPYPSALQSFALGSGMEIEVDMYIKSWPVPTRKSGTKLMNQERRSAWLNYGDCIWKRHGVWGLDSQNRPIILKPNYFTTNPKTGAPINYYNDFYMPMVRRYKAAIQSVRPDHLVFFEPIPNEDPPTLTDTDRNEQGYVYAPHWYDLKALLTKNFDGLVTFDVQGLARGTKNVLSAMYFGLAGAEVNYTGQMRNIVETGKKNVGQRSKGSSPDVYKRFLTEVFVPNFHYKFPDMQIVVKVSDGEWKYDQEKQSLVWFYDPQWKHVGDGGVVKHWLTVSTPLSYSEEAQVAASNRKGWSVWRVLWDFFEELCGKSR
ncbi:hypothetical protein HDU99_002038 [Rhizoclosmatium hyalinum]|nr:hypothetical protein HDU99_002038 [Rhizoclosmatium hyalinum]